MKREEEGGGRREEGGGRREEGGGRREEGGGRREEGGGRREEGGGRREEGGGGGGRRGVLRTWELLEEGDCFGFLTLCDVQQLLPTGREVEGAKVDCGVGKGRV